MKKFLTKKEATAIFKEEYKDVILSKDKGAIRLVWSMFTDNLHRNGEISDSQVNNWINPLDK